MIQSEAEKSAQKATQAMKDAGITVHNISYTHSLDNDPMDVRFKVAGSVATKAIILVISGHTLLNVVHIEAHADGLVGTP